PGAPDPAPGAARSRTRLQQPARLRRTARRCARAVQARRRRFVSVIASPESGPARNPRSYHYSRVAQLRQLIAQRARTDAEPLCSCLTIATSRAQGVEDQVALGDFERGRQATLVAGLVAVRHSVPRAGVK